jgi:ketosteroid isomerase-like protein
LRAKSLVDLTLPIALEVRMTNEEKLQLARKFLSVLSAPDEAVVKSVAVDDVIWTFPGTSPISGEARGASGVLARAKVIAAYGVHVEIIRPVYGYQGVAMILHNTGSKSGRVLDEHLAAVFSFRSNKIERLDTFLSDVPMAEAFFG